MHAPTCVTHCTAARLCTSAGEPGHDPWLLNLVIANSTALQVFSVRCIRLRPAQVGSTTWCRTSQRTSPRHAACHVCTNRLHMHRSRDGAFRLEAQSQMQLWGVVESLVTLPARSSAARDSVLVTFRCLAAIPDSNLLPL